MQSLAAGVDQDVEFGKHHQGSKDKVPNQHRIGGQLLESAYVDTAAYKAKKYGRSLTPDGPEKNLKE